MPETVDALEAILAEFLPDADSAAEVERVARVIFAATEGACNDRLIIGAAITRAFAGYWAKLAFDAGDPGRIVSAAALTAAASAAELAERLVDRRERGKP